MTDKKTRVLVMTALMAALIFVATYLIRIPNPATGGYSHLGDCMIFLAVVMLGRRSGAAAAAIGGALSDLLAGAAVWIVPTMVIKYVMAWMMGSVMKRKPENRTLQVVGAAAGGAFQIVAYTLVKIALIGTTPAVASIPNVAIQTAVGVVIFMLLSSMLAGRIVSPAWMLERKGETR